MNAVDTCEALFGAFTEGNETAIRALCAEDLVAIQNGAPPMKLNSLIRFTLAVTNKIKDFHYEDTIRSATASGFVEEHNVCGTLPNGEPLRIAACVVGEINQGKITFLREYLDTAAAAGLIAALS